jgi:uncharacterized membrane protein HdeD (DUF308 family)
MLSESFHACPCRVPKAAAGAFTPKTRKGDAAVNSPSVVSPPGFAVHKTEELREIWPFLVGMGVALMMLGAVAIGSSFIATMATVIVFGVLLLIGALFQVVTALWGRSWRGFFLHLLAGVLYLILGVFLIDHPVESALGMTLLVAVVLLASGLLRIVMSLVERFDGWGWMLLSGVVSFLLGIAIWRQWPLSGLSFIGLFVGIEMLCSGISWLMLGLAVRSVPKTSQAL